MDNSFVINTLQKHIAKRLDVTSSTFSEGDLEKLAQTARLFHCDVSELSEGFVYVTVLHPGSNKYKVVFGPWKKSNRVSSKITKNGVSWYVVEHKVKCILSLRVFSILNFKEPPKHVFTCVCGRTSVVE